MDSNCLLKNDNGVFECRFCGTTSPRGHWRPKTWMKKHQAVCSKKFNLQ